MTSDPVSNGAVRVVESHICGMTALDKWSGFKLTIKQRDMRLNNQLLLCTTLMSMLLKIELILVISVAMPLSLI